MNSYINNLILELDSINSQLDKTKEKLEDQRNNIEQDFVKLKREAFSLGFPLKPIPPSRILWFWVPPWEKDLLFDILSPFQRLSYYLYRKRKKKKLLEYSKNRR